MRRKNQLITIAIPTYNGEEYLRDCLESAINQTYPHTEVLIIDDKSTDNTLAIACAYKSKYNNVRIIKNEQNVGLVSNWNKCLREARGEWVKFLFQDDILKPHCIDAMYTAGLSYNCPLVICQRDFIIENNTSSQQKEYFTQNVKKLEHFFSTSCYISPKKLSKLIRNHLCINFIGEPIVLLYNKSKVEQFGYYNSDLSQLCDYEYVIRVATNTGFVFLVDTLAYFRVHGTSETTKNYDERSEKLTLIDKTLILHDFVYLSYYKKFRKFVSMFLYVYYFYYMYRLIKNIGKSRYYNLVSGYLDRYPYLRRPYVSFCFNKLKTIVKNK
ncbi:MAG: glycosyltransferase family 2 protein [bacterium]